MKRTTGILLCCVGTLLALGAVMVFSIISARASSVTVGVLYLLKHLLWVTGGVMAMLALRRFDYRRLEKWAKPIALVGLMLLVLVLIPGAGTMKNGARRWIRLGPVGFQPSEVAKLALLVAVCALAARRGEQMKEMRRGLLPAMAVVGASAALILLEPDFGTAALVGIMGTLVVLVAGAPVLPIAGAAALGGAGVGLLVWHSPARVDRVFAFLNPWTHAGPAAYQLQHSLISLGSGGILGRGLGASRQKLFFLPEPDSDFIFAIIGEELGLIGTLAVIFLFVVVVRQGMRISRRAPDAFGGLLAFGVTVMIALQALIHVAVVSASMPTKGIALPFVSSGGSSLLICLVGVGILLSIAAHSPDSATAENAGPAAAGGTETPTALDPAACGTEGG